MRGDSTVWRALAAARARNLADAGQAAPVSGMAGTTRRALLKAIASAGAAAGLPQPSHARPGQRVAIIGGGIAGLSALHHLREAGVDARLYEARQRLGGRMLTSSVAADAPWSKWEAPSLFEMGGQLVNTDHADMHALARVFGVPLVDRKAAPHRTMILAGKHVVAEASLAEGLRGIAAQIGRDADRLDRLGAPVAAEFDRMSIAGYLDRHAATMTAPWVRPLLEATSRSEYGVEPDRASAIELIFNLPTVDGARIEVLGGADERYVLQGGSSALIQAIGARYADRIETGRRLLSVSRAAGGVGLRFLDERTERADHVIVAVPAPITRQIAFDLPLPSAWRAFIAEMQLGRNEKVQCSTKGPACRQAVGCGGEIWQTDAQAGWTLGWDGSVHDANRVHQVWTWFLGSGQVDLSRWEGHGSKPIAHAFARAADLSELNESFANASSRTAWHREPLTLGAYVNYPPGQLTRFAHLLWLEADGGGPAQPTGSGRVSFVGEHLSDAYPGYMNGAAQTGRLAAEAITGRRVPPRWLEPGAAPS